DATALKTKSLNYFERLAKDLPSLEVPNKINNPNAPKIKITSPQDGQVFSDKIKNIIVTAEISDDNDRNPAVYGVGKFSLEPGLNPVIVVAVDKDGNANNSFVVVERSQ
ncbi:hypothetical protein KAR91_04555, partial [Candidatus Pacearchaeota archaeon]|nr:hypothetical protein [Candidatus Pacearchaeota archaeon]